MVPGRTEGGTVRVLAVSAPDETINGRQVRQIGVFYEIDLCVQSNSCQDGVCQQERSWRSWMVQTRAGPSTIHIVIEEF